MRVTDPPAFLKVTFDSFYIIVSSSAKLQELEQNETWNI